MCHRYRDDSAPIFHATTTPVPTVVHHFGGSSSSGSDYDDYNGAEYQNEIDEYEVRKKLSNTNILPKPYHNLDL